jgi:hypothetical protein
MTKSERDDLQRLIRTREKVMNAAASQRSAELLADFEQQLASVYSFDQDETWKAVTAAAEAEVERAQHTIAGRCEELGIPARFAPELIFSWRGRGENAIAERRNELRKVAQTRIAAIEKAAVTRIKMACLDAQAKVVANGLTTAAAIAFFEALPTVEALMPPLAVSAASLEEMLQARTDEQRRRLGYADYR